MRLGRQTEQLKTEIEKIILNITWTHARRKSTFQRLKANAGIYLSFAAEGTFSDERESRQIKEDEWVHTVLTKIRGSVLVLREVDARRSVFPLLWCCDIAPGAELDRLFIMESSVESMTSSCVTSSQPSTPSLWNSFINSSTFIFVSGSTFWK